MAESFASSQKKYSNSRLVGVEWDKDGGLYFGKGQIINGMGQFTPIRPLDNLSGHEDHILTAVEPVGKGLALQRMGVEDNIGISEGDKLHRVIGLGDTEDGPSLINEVVYVRMTIKNGGIRRGWAE